MIKDERILLAHLEKTICIENKSEVFDKLIFLLNNAKNPTVINKTALLLMDNYGNIAVKPLVMALGNSNTQACKGTILYALSNLNCTDYFDDLFIFILNDGFEVSRQAFNVIGNIVQSIPYQKRQEKCRILVDRIKEMSEDINFYLSAYEMLRDGSTN